MPGYCSKLYLTKGERDAVTAPLSSTFLTFLTVGNIAASGLWRCLVRCWKRLPQATRTDSGSLGPPPHSSQALLEATASAGEKTGGVGHVLLNGQAVLAQAHCVTSSSLCSSITSLGKAALGSHHAFLALLPASENKWERREGAAAGGLWITSREDLDSSVYSTTFCFGKCKQCCSFLGGSTCEIVLFWIPSPMCYSLCGWHVLFSLCNVWGWGDGSWWLPFSSCLVAAFFSPRSKAFHLQTHHVSVSTFFHMEGTTGASVQRGTALFPSTVWAWSCPSLALVCPASAAGGPWKHPSPPSPPLSECCCLLLVWKKNNFLPLTDRNLSRKWVCSQNKADLAHDDGQGG